MTTERDEQDRTPPWNPTDTEAVGGEAIEPGRQVGRYLLEGVLGEGTYGRVYLARHEVLGRRFAIKVLHGRHGSQQAKIRTFFNEALVLTHLDHPGIVPIHDAGWTEEGLYYIVSRYMEGGDLGAVLRRTRLGHREAAALVSAVAEALGFAHGRGLVHRDVKPANILLDAAGKPCLADFGIALRDRDYGRGTRHTGTPAYMSPEQARGEGHMVDGHSDIFSLGVLLYELLTGRRPFRGATREELMGQILGMEPPPPRQIDETIPEVLEWVCLRALAKRASERHATAGEMAEELRAYLREAPPTEGPAGPVVTDREASAAPALASTWGIGTISTLVVSPGPGSSPSGLTPKGLRPYDARDADSFPELLPGPRDRAGLPESIAHWRSRIEGPEDPGRFRFGLIFGPSGGGKTSLVKAGLLPRLSGNIRPIYVEASAEGTEATLLRRLGRHGSGLPPGLGLADTLIAVRKGQVLPPGQKLLIVLDQFERWLLTRKPQDRAGLLAALRQCDGEHATALVVVRDDAWLGASRFLRDLGGMFAEGENATAVDPLDVRHARGVLEVLGRAYGVLPEWGSDLSGDQESFLDRAIAGLDEGDGVLPIRLALLAEVARAKSWKPGALEDIFRRGDLGTALLEETFDVETARPEHRLHRQAARSVLGALLPEEGSGVSAPERSYQNLLAASGFGERSTDFDTILSLVEDRLHLVSSLEPATFGDATRLVPAGVEERVYRLSHDYLVGSLRRWLTRDSREAG